MKFFFFLFYSFLTFRIPRKLQDIDVRSTNIEKEKDNPLADLWDISHIKVAK